MAVLLKMSGSAICTDAGGPDRCFPEGVEGVALAIRDLHNPPMRQRDSAMTEENLVLEQLRKIRTELDAARERDHEILARLSGIETGLTRIARDEAGNYAENIQDRHAIDRIRERLDRIERRLELAD
ncbi:hypothetical protein [Acidithiobacillus thiooxidans]|uniref:Uncharacterized protein n=1 Tax=Acidithiobacillus thiooxidans TaxID=930 RepID=A0A1C2II08_ACITH|nr:hypothetical protein [Acidithiobacillus thiooxidans]OCX75602.1 hypothetical protein A6M23_02310 [Acidithiobacillus thiooxidans]OCX80650.1 hypothetical protein A6P08_15760 [Acidithiobacillus thiooxidans]